MYIHGNIANTIPKHVNNPILSNLLIPCSLLIYSTVICFSVFTVPISNDSTPLLTISNA